MTRRFLIPLSLVIAVASITFAAKSFSDSREGLSRALVNPQIAEVIVEPLTFVNPGSNTAPRLTDLKGVYLMRMELTPAKEPVGTRILDVCKTGGFVVARIANSSVPPFIISAVSSDGDVMVFVESRERALEIFSTLHLKLGNGTENEKR